jgi:hypothetical protein
MLGTILMVFAFVYFCIGTVAGYDAAVPWPRRFNFISAGLAAWSLAELLAKTIH